MRNGWLESTRDGWDEMGIKWTTLQPKAERKDGGYGEDERRISLVDLEELDVEFESRVSGDDGWVSLSSVCLYVETKWK